MTVSKQNTVLKSAFALLFVALSAGGRTQQNPYREAALKDVRSGFHMQLVPQKRPKQRLEKAPAAFFRTLKYPSPTNALIAKKIVQDTGAKSQLSISTSEVNRLFTR